MAEKKKGDSEKPAQDGTDSREKRFPSSPVPDVFEDAERIPVRYLVPKPIPPKETASGDSGSQSGKKGNDNKGNDHSSD